MCHNITDCGFQGIVALVQNNTGGSRVLEEGGTFLNQLSVHDITGDIKCIFAVHGKFIIYKS